MFWHLWHTPRRRTCKRRKLTCELLFCVVIGGSHNVLCNISRKVNVLMDHGLDRGPSALPMLPCSPWVVCLALEKLMKTGTLNWRWMHRFWRSPWLIGMTLVAIIQDGAVISCYPSKWQMAVGERHIRWEDTVPSCWLVGWTPWLITLVRNSPARRGSTVKMRNRKLSIPRMLCWPYWMPSIQMRNLFGAQSN
jgi:hypothetical protein